MLEHELTEVLHAAGLRGPQERAVAARLGWDGSGTKTLAEAAAGEGYSRERVRQLEARLRDYGERERLQLPLTEAALRLVEGSAPIARSSVGPELASAGISAAPFELSGLMSAATIGRLPTEIYERGGVVLVRSGLGSAAKTALLARRLVTQSGAATVATVARESGGATNEAHARRLLDARTDVLWLDDRRDWFVLKDVANRATRMLRKMLSISTALSFAEIDDGMRRSFRPVHLPREILCRMCESLGWVVVDRSSDTVTAGVALDAERILSPLERSLVAIFDRAGPILTFKQAVELGQREGLNHNSVGLYLTRTPVLRTLARGRYAVRRNPAAHRALHVAA